MLFAVVCCPAWCVVVVCCGCLLFVVLVLFVVCCLMLFDVCSLSLVVCCCCCVGVACGLLIVALVLFVGWMLFACLSRVVCGLMRNVRCLLLVVGCYVLSVVC